MERALDQELGGPDSSPGGASTSLTLCMSLSLNFVLRLIPTMHQSQLSLIFAKLDQLSKS